MKNKTVILFVGILLAGTASMATVVDFTAAEGYQSGELVWAPGQGLWKGNTGYTISTNPPGVVTMNSTGSYQKVVYGSGATSGKGYNVGITFSFDRANTTLGADAQVLSVGFSDLFGITPNGNLEVCLVRTSADATKYKLQFADTSGTTINLFSTTFLETALGFDTPADASSDKLWMGLSVTKTATTDTWTGLMVVSNLTTGVTVATMDVGTFTTAGTFYSGTMYAAMNSKAAQTTSFTSNRAIDQISLDVIPEPTSVGLFVVSSVGILVMRRLTAR